MLAAEWAQGRTSAWVQGEAGWEQLAVDRGAWQGTPYSNVAFCCALAADSLRAPPNTITNAAFLSSCLCTSEAVQHHVGRPLQREPDREEAQRSRYNLQRAGVQVDERGKVELSDEVKHTMKKAQCITKDNDEANNPAEQVHGPARRTLSKSMRNHEQIKAAARCTQSNEEEKARRLEAGGPGIGGTWSAPPDGTLMPNAHWRAATQARTGCIKHPTEHQMQNQVER